MGVSVIWREHLAFMPVEQKHNSALVFFLCFVFCFFYLNLPPIENLAALDVSVKKQTERKDFVVTANARRFLSFHPLLLLKHCSLAVMYKKATCHPVYTQAVCNYQLQNCKYTFERH